MEYGPEIESVREDPLALEALYRQARQAGEAAKFAAEVASRHASLPDNILISAWYFRLQPEGLTATERTQPSSPVLTDTRIERHAREINWRLAIALSLCLSILYWFLAGDTSNLSGQIPGLFLAWAPAAACFITIFLAVASRGNQAASGSIRPSFLTSSRRALLIMLGVIGLAAFAMWLSVTPHLSYRTLMVLHLPLLSWAAILLYVVGPGSRDADRFAALVKSAEIVLTGGIFFGAAMAFVAITLGLFGAIGVNFPEPVIRLLFAGVPGFIPVLAVALVYDPALPAGAQRFDQGLPKLISSVARILLPFALIVGVFYILLIPANFLKPFEQREVLIIYNAMLFGVMALLLFATPLNLEDVPEKWRNYLRRAILALAVMADLVSLYALSATIYRTAIGGLTMNRMTVIGWNVVNIGLLCVFLYKQFRNGRAMWIPSTQSVFRIGIIAYGLWTIFVILSVPLLFPLG